MTALLLGLSLLPARLPADQTAAPALPFTVLSRDARRPLAARTIGGQEMFALDDLARLFNLTVREEAAAGGLTVAVNGQTIVLSPQQPLASVAGRMISLPAAPVRDGRTWYVPVDFVGRALAPIFGSRLELRKPSRLILVGDIRMPRVARTSSRSAAYACHARRRAANAAHRRAGRIAPADPLRGGRARRGAAGHAVHRRLQAIHVGETPQVIALDLGPRFASFRAADQPGTAGAARIVVDLVTQTEATPPPGPCSRPPRRRVSRCRRADEPPPLLDLPPAGGLRAIVIDAGPRRRRDRRERIAGHVEKNVTLAVARRLKAALETRLGVRVLLTRDGDQTVGLDQRAALANNNKADLFLSLHANASLRPAVSGAEVFYLSLAEYGDEATAAAHGKRKRFPSSAAAIATSRSCSGTWRRRATSSSRPRSRDRSRRRCASACR